MKIIKKIAIGMGMLLSVYSGVNYLKNLNKDFELQKFANYLIDESPIIYQNFNHEPINVINSISDNGETVFNEGRSITTLDQNTTILLNLQRHFKRNIDMGSVYKIDPESKEAVILEEGDYITFEHLFLNTIYQDKVRIYYSLSNSSVSDSIDRTNFRNAEIKCSANSFENPNIGTRKCNADEKKFAEQKLEELIRR